MTAAESERLSWLDSPQRYAVSYDPDGGGVTVDCSEDEFDIVLMEPPPVRELRIVVRRRLSLRGETRISRVRQCRLSLIADNATATGSDVESRFTAIRCSVRPSAPRSHSHELRVSGSQHVEVSGGNWHLDAHPGTLDKDHGLTLIVDNRDEFLRISSAARLVALYSYGNHEFDLSEPREAIAGTDESDDAGSLPSADEYEVRGPVNVFAEAGITTLRQPIEGIEVQGRGKLRTLGTITRCHINMLGSLEAHNRIVHSDILLGGDLEADGPIVLSDQTIKCHHATFRGGLETAGDTYCETLDVQGHITSAGLIMANDLRCKGTLKAERLAVLGSIEVG